ncbi:MAG TPA: hypothetical protein V6C81_10805 [Planktothrix sp.]
MKEAKNSSSPQYYFEDSVQHTGFSGQLSQNHLLRQVIQEILERSYAGVSVLELRADEPEVSGKLYFLDGHHIVAATSRAEGLAGYELARRLLTGASAKYRYDMVPSTQASRIDSDLHIHLQAVLNRWPDLPAEYGPLFDESAQLDRTSSEQLLVPSRPVSDSSAENPVNEWLKSQPAFKQEIVDEPAASVDDDNLNKFIEIDTDFIQSQAKLKANPPKVRRSAPAFFSGLKSPVFIALGNFVLAVAIFVALAFGIQYFLAHNGHKPRTSSTVVPAKERAAPIKPVVRKSLAHPRAVGAKAPSEPEQAAPKPQGETTSAPQGATAHRHAYSSEF